MNIIPNATRQQMLAKEATIIADYVRSILSYDEDTGTLTRTKTLAHNAKAGDIVGYPTTNGYQRLKIRGKHYRSYRVASLIKEGRWPLEIDHADLSSGDHRPFRPDAPSDPMWIISERSAHGAREQSRQPLNPRRPTPTTTETTEPKTGASELRWTLYAKIFANKHQDVEIITTADLDPDVCDDCAEPIGIRAASSSESNPPPAGSWGKLKKHLSARGHSVDLVRCECCDEPIGLVCSEASLGDEGEHIVH